MTPATQFKQIASLLRKAVADSDGEPVALDTVKHILLVTDMQVEAAELGLLIEEKPE